MILTHTKYGKTYEADANALAPKALSYLLQYGWTQSLQDCIAGREARLREELRKENPTWSDDELALNVQMHIEALIDKRAAAILAGTVAERNERDPLRAIAESMVRNGLKTKNFKATKEQFAKFVDDLLSGNKRQKVVDEHERRKAQSIDVDIGV